MVPTRWLVLTVELPPEADQGPVLEHLLGMGATAVEERDRKLVTHLPPPDDPEARVQEVRAALDRKLGGSGSARVSWGWQPHEEWSETWRRGLAPRRIGGRLLVSPTWIDPEPRRDDLVVRIDPGMAFGTAEHATTRGCLELLESVVEEGDRVVDVGAGTGILSIAAGLLGAHEVIAAESDEFSCEAARKNAEANGVGDRIDVRHELLDASGLADLGPVDGVVANIQSRVLLNLLPGAARALFPGGWLVLGGVLASERDDLIGTAEQDGLTLDAEVLEGEWWSGRFRSRGPG